MIEVPSRVLPGPLRLLRALSPRAAGFSAPHDADRISLAVPAQPHLPQTLEVRPREGDRDVRCGGQSSHHRLQKRQFLSLTALLLFFNAIDDLQ